MKKGLTITYQLRNLTIRASLATRLKLFRPRSTARARRKRLKGRFSSSLTIFVDYLTAFLMITELSPDNNYQWVNVGP